MHNLDVDHIALCFSTYLLIQTNAKLPHIMRSPNLARCCALIIDDGPRDGKPFMAFVSLTHEMEGGIDALRLGAMKEGFAGG